MKNETVNRSAPERKGSGKEYTKYVSLFSKVWNDQKPLAKLFRTSRSGYIYDTGTNKIMGCDDLVFDLLLNLYTANVESAVQTFLKNNGHDALIHAADSIKQSIENQNILKFKKAEDFHFDPCKYSVDEMINEHLELLVLEVTEKCNLRCAYCPYSDSYAHKRGHGTRDMTREVMKKALHYFKDHSIKQEKVYITAYGGEPGLCWGLIEWTTHYAKELFKDKQLTFSVTTNGTSITPEMARFLYENDFKTLVSIDGPAPIHDRFRKYKNGKGSYKDAIRGLKYLVDAYGDSAEKNVKLSMVYTPPFSGERLDEVAGLWMENKWLPAKMRVNIVYPIPGSLSNEFYKQSAPEDKNIREWAVEKFREKYNRKGFSNPIADEISGTILTKLINLPVYDVPRATVNFNGCCVPAARRLFVTVDGEFRLCERIDSNAPIIGNIDSGLDIDIIKTEYIDRYKAVSFPECSVCWAARLCNSCFQDAFKDGVITASKRLSGCASIKKSREKHLEYYCSLLEDDPTGLKRLLEEEVH